jgi:hypothetical protein
MTSTSRFTIQYEIKDAGLKGKGIFTLEEYSIIHRKLKYFYIL